MLGKTKKEEVQKAEKNKAFREKMINQEPADTHTGNHGKLRVEGTQLVDETGKSYQLRGVSTHGLTVYPEYANAASFKTMRDSWGINAVRLALYTEEENGYCVGDSNNQAKLKKLIHDSVRYATELGLYVIIDWHILQDNDPNMHKDEAVKFFDEMSERYKDNINVLYEICNEPNGGTLWSEVKSYAEEIIPVIRKNDKDGIIIVGTPTWSQDVDIAVTNPIQGYSNIMYTLHFYAETHRDSLRNRMQNAIQMGLPVFVSEYGICDASGNGLINEDEADKWIEIINQYGLSSFIWNLSNKDEASALIVKECKKTSDWEECDLSVEGKWFIHMMEKQSGKA